MGQSVSTQSMVHKDVINGVLVVIAGFLVHLSFGCIYTIGNMAPYVASYIQKYVDPAFNKGQVVWLSASALAAQGFSMPIGGILAPKLGVKIVVIVGSLINSGVYMLTYFAIKKGFIYVLLMHIISLGLGVGFAYSVIMHAAASWFPKRGGLIIGFIAAGFGLGALVFTPIQMRFINPDNIPVNNVTRMMEDEEVLARIPVSYLVIGGAMMGLQLIGCIIIRRKPSQDKSSEINTVIVEKNDEVLFDSEEPDHQLDQNNEETLNMSPKQILRSRYFYLAWFVMFCNIIPITLITSAYKVFGQESINDDNYLSIIATLSSLFNCLGRFFWGFLVDKFSFKLPFSIMLVIWSTSLFCFPFCFSIASIGKYVYGCEVCLLFFSMAGVFAIMPAGIRILFGPKHMATNYGMVFSAFSIGSILTAFASQMAKGQWDLLFYISGGICFLDLCIVVWIFDPMLPKMARLCCPCALKDHRR